MVDRENKKSRFGYTEQNLNSHTAVNETMCEVFLHYCNLLKMSELPPLFLLLGRQQFDIQLVVCQAVWVMIYEMPTLFVFYVDMTLNYALNLQVQM